MPKKIARKYQPTDSRYDSSLEEKFHKIWSENTYAHDPILSVHYAVSLGTPIRNWELDFAFIPQKIAIELQGWGTGHLSYKGVLRDQHKHNDLILDGWLVLYFMSYHVEESVGRQIMLKTLNKALEIKGVKRTTNTDITQKSSIGPSRLANLGRRTSDQKPSF